ncbi:MAG: DNA replication complex GINS family protein [Thermoplasmata archaeon]|nr:DNA replication complex GINS family protein [Thermoplasmata archaeon]
MADHYTQLLEWRRVETTTRGLAKLPHDFYGATRAYLAEARTTFERELRENPAGRKGDLARQTYHRASQIARDVVESRMTKILSFSFQAAVGGARDVANLLPEEKGLFDDVTRTLSGHRAAVAPFLEVTGSTPPAPGPSLRPSGPVAPAIEPKAATATATVFVRILKDQRPIDTGSETLDLRKDDVLSLPERTAQILIHANLAERVGPESRRPTT